MIKLQTENQHVIKKEKEEESSSKICEEDSLNENFVKKEKEQGNSSKRSEADSLKGHSPNVSDNENVKNGTGKEEPSIKNPEFSFQNEKSDSIYKEVVKESNNEVHPSKTYLYKYINENALRKKNC